MPTRFMTHMTLAQRVEMYGGLLALAAGLIAIGIRVFAPIVPVQFFGVRGEYVRYWSYWWVTFGFGGYPLGQVFFWVCVISLLAIGYGAASHIWRGLNFGRLFLWLGTIVLALDPALSRTPNVGYWTFEPMWVVAPVLLPALALALVASGAAAVTR